MARIAIAQVISTINLVLVLIAIVSAAPTNDLSSRSRIRARNRTLRDDQTSRDQPRKRDVQDDDQYPAETAHHHPHPHHGGGGGGHDNSRGAKNFMYAHQPSPKTYEFGYKRGNNHHTIERYEKAGPKHNFNTKVRWSDAKGGHGEMYWDYNHGPHSHHGDGGGGSGGGGGGHGHSHGGHGHSHGGHGHSHDGHGHPHGHHSEPVPSYLESESKTSITTPDEDHLFASDTRTSTKLLKRTGLEKESKKKPKKYSKKRRSKNANRASRQKYDVARSKDSRQHGDVRARDSSETVDISRVNPPSVFPQVLGFNPYETPAFAKSNESKTKKSKKTRDRKNRKSLTSQKDYGRRSKKKHFKSSPKDVVIPKLAYDLDTGRVYDENTETWYKLVKV